MLRMKTKKRRVQEKGCTLFFKWKWRTEIKRKKCGEDEKEGVLKLRGE